MTRPDVSEEQLQGIVCPLCRRVVYHPKPDPHVEGCRWGAMEKRIEALEAQAKKQDQRIMELTWRSY